MEYANASSLLCQFVGSVRCDHCRCSGRAEDFLENHGEVQQAIFEIHLVIGWGEALGQRR